MNSESGTQVRCSELSENILLSTYLRRYFHGVSYLVSARWTGRDASAVKQHASTREATLGIVAGAAAQTVLVTTCACRVAGSLTTACRTH